MLLYISILGLFISFVLLFLNARRYSSTIYLAVFCQLVSLYSLDQYVVLYSKSEFWISLFFGNVSFWSYLIGPMCYLYTRCALRDETRLKRIDLLHLIPTVVYLSASLPYILSSYSYKREIAHSIISDPGFQGTFHVTFLSDLFSNTAIYLSQPILAFLYVLGSIVFLIHFKLTRVKIAVSARQHFIFKWLVFFLGFQLLLSIGHFLLIFQVFHFDLGELLYNSNLFQFLSFIGLAGIMITPFFFPQILYGLPSFVQEKNQNEQQPNPIIEIPEIKKTVLNFEFDYMLLIVQKMATCMQEQKPFLQADFNLAQFSVLIQIPTHHLAYFFREVKKQSFNDYRNECRIDHAKMLIFKGKANNLTLEAIGTLSGFTNRNTFFTAFKKVEGIAPSTFLTQHIPTQE